MFSVEKETEACDVKADSGVQMAEADYNTIALCFVFKTLTMILFVHFTHST